MLIDTHCHLDFEKFDGDRDVVVARAAAAGVTGIVVPALDLANARTVLALAERYEAVYAAVGVHPNSAAGWEDGWIGELRRLADHEKVVAVGEIGLDYYWDKAPRPVQKRALAMQLELAAELELPVIIHNRESNEDVIGMLAASSLATRPLPGVLHSFLADRETADAALELGFYLGFTGPVTYKKNDALRRIVAGVPDDRILVETDAPFLTPQQHRGKRNEPAYVALIAERIAAVRGVEPAEFARQTTANARRLFSRIGASA
jgi:TatD DNase family protein